MGYVKQIKGVNPWGQRPLALNPTCDRCDLHQTSQTICCEPDGPDKAEIFLVGEALGANEELDGLPFVGDAGSKLDYLLDRAGLRREELFLTNTVRCRPPGNRNPKKKEVIACVPYLLGEILFHKPKVIVALGAVAAENLASWKELHGIDHFKLREWRGFPQRQTFRYQKITVDQETGEVQKGRLFEHTAWVIPTYHPSACLHSWEYDAQVIWDLTLARRYAAGEGLLKYPDTEYEVVESLADFQYMLDSLKAAGEYACDLETTGTDFYQDKILCAGFCPRPGFAWILPFHVLVEKVGKDPEYARPFWRKEDLEVITEGLVDLFLNTGVFGQNFKFDLKFLRRLLGLWKEFRIVWDTMLAHHCLDENAPHNLTFQTQTLLGWDKYDAAMARYKSKGEEVDFSKAPNRTVWEYLAHDVNGTYQLREIQRVMLQEEKTSKAFQAELDLLVPLADVEYRGVRIDVDGLVGLVGQYQKQAKKALAYLRKKADKLLKLQEGEVFNPNSSSQLGKLVLASGARLFKKTKAGAISVDKNVLASLALKKNVPGTIARNVQALRSANKMLGTYLNGASIQGGLEGAQFKEGDGGLLALVSQGRFHDSYNVHRTKTGRLTADRIQTIPRIGGIRSVFIPDSSDHVLISVDYSKIELRVLAWLANDAIMAQELIQDVDLHRKMAVCVKLNRDPTDEEFAQIGPTITPNERAIAKGVNFGIPYGRQAPSIVDANPDAFPLGMDRKLRIKTVDRIIDAYYDKYQGVYEYMVRQIRTAKKRGYLRTKFTGRKRRFSGVDWFRSDWSRECVYRDQDLGDMERQAQNFQIQSTASDELSKATNRAYDGIMAAGIPGFRIIMTLHDQLVFNVHRDYVEDVIPMIKGWMEVTLPKTPKHRYQMPLTVDYHVQEWWGQEEYE